MKLNLYQGTATIIVTLLGSGIFIVPALSATYSGWMALLLWFLMAILMLPVAFVFGKLGKIYPNAKGSAYFVENAFGKTFGKTTSLLYLSIIPIGPPVVIITGAAYLAEVFNTTELIPFIILISIIIFILNLISFHISSNINIFITSIIILLVSAFFIISLFQNFKISPHQLNLIKTMGIIFWCFVGIEAITHLSHEFKKENNFFKAIIIAIIVVAFMYMAATFSILVFNAYGNEFKNLSSFTFIASKIFPFAKTITGIMAFLICLMAVNLYIASLTRLATTFKIPFKKALSIIIIIVLSVSLLKVIFNFNIDLLIIYSNGVFVTVYFLVSLSALKLLENKKTALLAVLSMGFIIYTIGFDMIYTLAVFLLLFIFQKRGLKTSNLANNAAILFLTSSFPNTLKSAAKSIPFVSPTIAMRSGGIKNFGFIPLSSKNSCIIPCQSSGSFGSLSFKNTKNSLKLTKTSSFINFLTAFSL